MNRWNTVVLVLLLAVVAVGARLTQRPVTPKATWETLLPGQPPPRLLFFSASDLDLAGVDFRFNESHNSIEVPVGSRQKALAALNADLAPLRDPKPLHPIHEDHQRKMQVKLDRSLTDTMPGKLACLVAIDYDPNQKLPDSPPRPVGDGQGPPTFRGPKVLQARVRVLSNALPDDFTSKLEGLVINILALEDAQTTVEVDNRAWRPEQARLNPLLPGSP